MQTTSKTLEDSASDQKIATSKQPIYARYYPVKKISVVDIQQMYGVFQRYYEHTDVETFLKDLSKKSGVILIRTKQDDRIVGFSTIVSMDIPIGDKMGRGIFSGDTIIEREFWGTRALQFAFYRYCLLEKVLMGRRPLFWFLISKGYKTYLLMANNFVDYYPNPDSKNPELRDVVRLYCEKMFPGRYDTNRELLDFGENAQCLKGDVSIITDELRQKYPKIHFFESRNPTWEQGTELPCVGVIQWKLALNFVVKALRSPFTTQARQARVAK